MMITKTSLRWTDGIKALSERLRSLQITNKALWEIYEQSNKEMSAAPIPAPAMTNDNGQATMPKNIVPDLGWFDGNRTKFEDW